jgi:hypothetical protein
VIMMMIVIAAFGMCVGVSHGLVSSL